ncbi:hypothetical protein H2200_008321 [Cladophialophora chaetospira]|uniref:Nucleotide-diphospho-sugar transferase domain-containing protein n=1 Tax=Cladophialophora chaetospira TaxID=386627 RepID=A0AA38X5J2_9EURO|nr:hypothetical protein H2200_008321 [Cladophialophora chaetospira]
MLAGSTSSRLGRVALTSLTSFLILAFLHWTWTGRDASDLLDNIKSYTSSTKTPPSDFIAWLRQRGISHRRHPIITIGDSNYLPALHHLRHNLDKWKFGNDLVVLCLDQECADDKSLNGWYINLDPERKVMEQVAEAKLTASMDLLRAGYNFVFLDGDVYLTGSRNPFHDMLPISNHTWDMQFQKDFELPSTDLNIGWFFARASEATKEFFYRSYQQWRVTGAWDQKIMNEVARQMEDANALKLHRLDLGRFRNYMLEDHEALLFGAEAEAAKFIADSAIIHYTCVEQGLKNYYGTTFGGSTDLTGYYSAAPAMLALANIEGTSQAILQQIAFAMQIAEDTSRALIWPHSVFMIQQRAAGDTTKYVAHTNFPAVRVVNYKHAQRLGIELLESRFIYNQKRFPGVQARQTTIDVSTQLRFRGEQRTSEDMERLKKIIHGRPPDIIPTLDFSGFHAAEYAWLRPEDVHDSIYYEITTSDYQSHVANVSKSFNALLQTTGIEEYSAAMLSQLQICRNVDWDAGCLNVCEG